MAVKYVCKNGMEVIGPPYTKAEETEFYSRKGVGTMYAPSMIPPKPPAPPTPPRSTSPGKT
jgi:hypothetical protein